MPANRKEIAEEKEKTATSSKIFIKDNSLLMISALIIITLIWIVSNYIIIKWLEIGSFKINWVRSIVKQEILANEVEKVWWQENYDIVAKLQKQQIAQYVAQYKQQNWWWQEAAPQEQKKAPSDAQEIKNKLEVFIMAYCPFGEIAMKQVPALFKQFEWANLDFDVHYIAKKTWEWYTAADFESLHWVPEAEEDIRQLCIKKEYWVWKLVDYMMVRYADAANNWSVTDWPEKALESIKWDVKKIAECVTSWEGWKLLAEDVKRADSYWVQWSPTWLANNTQQFWWIEWKKIAESFCSYNKELPNCKEIKIESNSSNPNSTPACWN